MNQDPFSFFFEEDEKFSKILSKYEKDPKKFKKENDERKEKREFYLKKYKKFLKKNEKNLSEIEINGKIAKIKELINLNYENEKSREKLFLYLNKILNDKKFKEDFLKEKNDFENFENLEKEKNDLEEIYDEIPDSVYKELGKSDMIVDKGIRYRQEKKGEKYKK